MRFQITIRPAATLDAPMASLSIFVVDEPDWESAAAQAVRLGSALGLEYGQYQSEIIYAADEPNTIRNGALHKTEIIQPKSGQSTLNAGPSLERSLELLLTEETTTVTDDELPNHFVTTPLDFEQRKAVRESARYLRSINSKATGIHRLNTREQEVSLFYSALFAIPLYLFRDGNWICEAVDHTKNCGIGSLPADAVADFFKSNNINTHKP